MDIDELLGIDYDDPAQRLARDLVAADDKLLEDLVAARKRAQMSQEDVAHKMGVSASAVSRIESGERDARLSTLRRFAHAVGVRVLHQVEGDEINKLRRVGGSSTARHVNALFRASTSSVHWVQGTPEGQGKSVNYV